MTYTLDAVPRRPTMVESVMERIKQLILGAQMAPGDKLPSQDEIVAKLGVSRTVVREATKGLETLGILYSRQGGGVFVKEFDARPLAGRIAFELDRLAPMKRLEYLYEVRERFEVSAVDLIVARMDTDDEQRIARILEAFQQRPTEDADALHIDYTFHCALLDASHNPVVSSFSEILRELFTQLANQPESFLKANYTEIHRGHAELFAIFQSRDVDRARAAMKRHIARSKRNKLQYLAHDEGD